VVTIAVRASIVLLTPVVWGNWNQHIPLVASSYFTSATGSLFPLFPWSAYILLGAGMGILYAIKPSSIPPAAAAGVGVMLILAGIALDGMPVRL
jgi:uncharacterized membrane protein